MFCELFSRSSLDDVEDSVLSPVPNKLSGIRSSQEAHLHSSDKLKDVDSLSSSSAKSDLVGSFLNTSIYKRIAHATVSDFWYLC